MKKRMFFMMGGLLAVLAAVAQVVQSGATAQGGEIVLNEAGAYERKEVVTVDSVSAAVLFDRAMIALTEWTGPDGRAKAGIDYQNQETHTVVYKGTFYAGSRKWMTTSIESYANVTVRVRCKDGRAQVVVTVPSVESTVKKTGQSRTWAMKDLLKELEKRSGSRKEKGEEFLERLTVTADGIVAAMSVALKSGGIGGGDDDF